MNDTVAGAAIVLRVLLPVQCDGRPLARRLRCGTASWIATLAAGKAPERTLSEV